jgi:hypothetical protein
MNKKQKPTLKSTEMRKLSSSYTYTGALADPWMEKPEGGEDIVNCEESLVGEMKCGSVTEWRERKRF